jgi:hypothetical protein
MQPEEDDEGIVVFLPSQKMNENSLNTAQQYFRVFVRSTV